ncbi:MAG: V4R domain protein [Methanocella sp. PtaU1.Bin125]|nr:MAG: V4R domain protein [Methanocella sp. PtaU1.Bin125]
MKKTPGQEPIELFSTAAGIRAVDSPVRVKIIAMLKDREMPFDAIVEGTGRAKSTISVHLNDMSTEGIIGSRLDPKDRRKKIFFLNSGYIGGLLRDKILVDDIRDLFSRNGPPDVPDFFKIIFRMIRVELYMQGINVDPVLSDAGYKVGGALYEQIGSPDLDELLDRLEKFWSGHKLGRIEVRSRSPLIIYVYDCFECEDLPLLGRPACAFDLGMLRAIFYAHFGEDRAVDETECYAMGHDHCCFIIGNPHR